MLTRTILLDDALPVPGGTTDLANGRVRAVLSGPQVALVPLAALRGGLPHRDRAWTAPDPAYAVVKLAIDKIAALLALPLVAAMAFLLLVLNPFLNPGPVFFRQPRMGQDGERFVIWKFRTMVEAAAETRDAHGALEEHRITSLGRVMRRMRLDEWPNFINVLLGHMSLVGPRPDAWDHAQVYVRDLPHYGRRLRAKPGITGLAQVIQGYAEGLDQTASKAEIDGFYVANCSLRLDAYIALRTAAVVLSGFGGR